MAAAMNGLDALVFTGGVGENSASVRAEAAGRLSFLGVDIDATKNSAMKGDGDVSARQAQVRTLVVHAREDVEVARDVRRLFASLR
jgi:acetate kinase